MSSLERRAWCRSFSPAVHCGHVPSFSGVGGVTRRAAAPAGSRGVFAPPSPPPQHAPVRRRCPCHPLLRPPPPRLCSPSPAPPVAIHRQLAPVNVLFLP